MFYAATRLRDIARAPHKTPEKDAVPQRLGQTRDHRPDGCLIWMHAHDAADTGAIAALCEEIARLRGEPVWGLVTSVENAQGANAVAIHQLVPGETSGSVKRFLDHWTPDAGILIGAPQRPVLIAEAAARGIPLYLAASRRGQIAPDGRLSLLAASLLEHFTKFLASSATEAQAISGGNVAEDRVTVTGPLSDTILAPPCNQVELDDLVKTIAGRPIWLAAHVTSGELAAVEVAQRRTIRAAHRLLLIVVPRVPEDGANFAATLEARGWRTALRSKGEEPDENIQVYVADTDGEMGLWYRLAPITFLGGTFDAEENAADPFEPASLGSAVVHGPHVGKNSHRFARLRAASATAALPTRAELGDAIFTLLAPDRAATLAHAGWSVTSESAHVVENLAAMIGAELDPVFDSGGAD